MELGISFHHRYRVFNMKKVKATKFMNDFKYSDLLW